MVALALPTRLLQAATPMPQHDDSKNRAALFVADTVDDWARPESLKYNGLLVKRPFHGKWDVFARDIDLAVPRFGFESALTAEVENGTPKLLAARLCESVSALLATADLPPLLSKQILSDALSMGCTLGSMCESARKIDIKLEIFGNNTCARWHQDHFGCRAIVSYTGHTGTEYSRDANVDFWELQNCGKNPCIIRNFDEIESVGVGDLLLIKGTQFAGVYGGANGLVHKSPEKRYHDDGRILNRLVLKLDVGTFGRVAEATARATAKSRANETLAMKRVRLQ